jgi:hypothetical protein
MAWKFLTINNFYFRIGRPLERKIYELARKDIGKKIHPLAIGMAVLQKGEE